MFGKSVRMAVVSKEEEPDSIRNAVKKAGFKLVERKPDFVLSHGGDGTLLIAERQYPGIPKILVKDSDVCNSCLGYEHPLAETLAKVKSGAYELEEHTKLHARWERQGRLMGDFTCSNEFNIRNQLLIQALRFKLLIGDEQPFGQELVGDGAVISTAFGSKAYYYSITKSSFDDGIGIALNNAHLAKSGLHTSRDKTVTVEITRMEADFAIDNDPNIQTLEPGDKIIINASAEKLKIVRPK